MAGIVFKCGLHDVNHHRELMLVNRHPGCKRVADRWSFPVASPPLAATKKILVTGSAGLIGSEVVRFYADQGWAVEGLDNNLRADFFGPAGDTTWARDQLIRRFQRYTHHSLDIRDRDKVVRLVSELRPDAIVHAAAQPSHDLAAQRPFDDFDVNAVGTLNLLEAARRGCPESPFVLLSTNKVYGDAPNEIAMKETATRWDYDDERYANGIPETFRIDRSKHSLFGDRKSVV